MPAQAADADLEHAASNLVDGAFFNSGQSCCGIERIYVHQSLLADFIEAFSKVRLGREMIRTADTPAFAGNRVGFKVLNEAAQLAEEHGPLLVDRLVGPYTGRALTPLATIDLVGWDIHRAIVDNVYENSDDEAHATLKLPDYMAKLMGQGVLGNKSGGGFFRRDGKTRQVLDPATGDPYPFYPDLVTSGLAVGTPGTVATWQEALEFTASRLKGIRETYGRKSLGVITSSRCTNEETYLVQKLARAVFLTARCLADDHDAGLGVAVGKHQRFCAQP